MSIRTQATFKALRLAVEVACERLTLKLSIAQKYKHCRVVFTEKEERLYRAHRRRHFKRLVMLWWPVPLLVLASFEVIVWFSFGATMGHDDRQTWLMTASVIGSLLSGSICLAHTHWGQRHYERWIPWIAGAVITIEAATLKHLRDAELVHFQVDVILLTAIIMSFGFQLSIRSVALMHMLGLLGHLLTHLIQGGLYNATAWWLHGLASCFGCIGVMMQEGRERLGFQIANNHAARAQTVHQENARLNALAVTDWLTGCNNRRAFDDMLAHEWARAQRNKTPLALLMLDIDHFKAYNDRYGHAAGDECLRTVAEALADVLKRPSDLLARYGGEEFVALLPATDEAGARAVGIQMLSAVDALQWPHATSDTAPHLTVSIGFASTAMVESAGYKAAQLLHQADLALYKAKTTGRHRVCG